jgi:hypothetical protein
MADHSIGAAGGPSRSLARDALVAFARRNPATQADVDHVMRSLAMHDSWLVPVAFAERAWGQSRFSQTIAFPEAGPNPVLNVFTDRESAQLAEGQPYGVYGGPVSGVTLMRALDPSVEALIVNPASPREHQWFVASGGFEIAFGWAGAIAVERALADRGNGPAPTAELRRHRYHLLVEQRTQAVAQIFLPDIDGAVAVCFTATDRVEEYLASLPPQMRSEADFPPIEGPQLFDLMRGMAAAGLVINAGSDDQTALTGEDITEIVSAAPVGG